MTNTVLITGLAGFIGSHVADRCLKQGMNIVGLDDLSGGFLENVPDGVTFIEGSVKDQNLIANLFDKYKFTYVYHIAAYAAEGLSHFIRRYNYETNLVGSINLINESVKHDVQCFIFTSSIAVYGAGQTPMMESMIPEPEDPYGISKFAVELDLQSANKMFGLPYIIFRPHNVYGERQNIADRYRNVIGIFMNQVMEGKPMTIYGDGEQTRAFSHIDDVAPLIAKSPLLAETYNQVFNIGADTPYSVLELTKEIANAFDTEPKVTHLPARNEVIHAFSDHEKVKKYFGSDEVICLREGIMRMAKWARERGAVEPVIFSNIEIRKKLPPSWNI